MSTTHLAIDLGASSGRAILGTLDGTGKGTAQLNTGKVAPEHVGTMMYFACLLIEPLDLASNPVVIEIVP